MNCNNYYIGPTGPSGVGIPGVTGATGATGPQGQRGPSQRGPAGPPGPSDKSFIIPHPTNEDNYLVHVCLEGPEGGIYYKGIGKITEGNSTTISLPEYCRNFGYEFTVFITGIYNGTICNNNATSVINNCFTVFSDGEKSNFQWLVIGKRCDLVSEIDKRCEIKGQGPYAYA